jgi:hypothetical protein
MRPARSHRAAQAGIGVSRFAGERMRGQSELSLTSSRRGLRGRSTGVATLAPHPGPLPAGGERGKEKWGQGGQSRLSCALPKRTTRSRRRKVDSERRLDPTSAPGPSPSPRGRGEGRGEGQSLPRSWRSRNPQSERIIPFERRFGILSACSSALGAARLTWRRNTQESRLSCRVPSLPQSTLKDLVTHVPRPVLRHPQAGILRVA